MTSENPHSDSVPERTSDHSERPPGWTTQEQKLLGAITQAQQLAVSEVGSGQIFQGMLETLVQVTSSRFGLLGELRIDEAGQPVLRVETIVDTDDDGERRSAGQRDDPWELIDVDTLFAGVVSGGRPVTTEEPPGKLQSLGLRPGDVPFQRILAAPLKSADTIIGVAMVANRHKPYSQRVIDFIEPLVSTCGNMLVALRHRRSQEDYEEEVEATNRQLRQQIMDRVRAEGALERFFALSLDMLIVMDRQGQVRHANPAWSQVLGYTLEELQSRPVFALVHPDDRDATRQLGERLLATGAPILDFENRYRCKDGSYRWLRWSAAASREDMLIYAVARDVTDDKASSAATAARLHELEQRANQMTALAEMGELLHSCDDANDIAKVLDAFLCRMFPTDSGSVYQILEGGGARAVATWGDPLPLTLRSEDCWALRRARPHRVGHDAARIVCEHVQHILGASICAPLLAHGEAWGLLHIAFDPSQPASLQEAEHQLALTVADQIGLAVANVELRQTLKEQSIRDALTGLFNRRYMEETLDRELKRAEREERPLSVVMVDIDHFKRYNDTHGHIAADQLLTRFGSFLRDWFRREDVVCRFGGEEFVVVMPTADPADALSRTQSGLDALAADKSVDGASTITFSAGVAGFPHHGSARSDLLSLADKAMYRAKQEGRARVHLAREVKPITSGKPGNSDAAA